MTANHVENIGSYQSYIVNPKSYITLFLLEVTRPFSVGGLAIKWDFEKYRKKVEEENTVHLG